MKITVIEDKKEVQISCKEKQTVLEALTEQHIYMDAPCAGNGTCGKCKIRFMTEASDSTETERKLLNKEELENGVRLACKVFPKDGDKIVVKQYKKEDFSILADYGNEKTEAAAGAYTKFGIAIDIGTTTIAMQLVEMEQGNVIKTITEMNSQKNFGADVISRIEASNGGKLELLKQSILNDLQTGIEQLLANFTHTIEKIVIAGNTTMIHLLMGYSCKTLGVFPFTPYYAGVIETTLQDTKTTILPSISAFVGGDITSGLLACDFWKKESISLLIDLGTNGEMAIGNKNHIMVTSTAAGPAFEGGNILHGIGSVSGAISNVSIENNKAHVKTINDGEPLGICGTGVIETTYELLKNELIDETGLLAEEYFDDGFLLAKAAVGTDIVFTQRDVREIQLAKAAVCAGIETLLRRYGTTYEQIDTVYLAGGFGYRVDIIKAIGIGLLPKELEGKIKTVGNSSLHGAVCYLTDKDADKKIQNMIDSAKEINLSNDKDFNELYMDGMYF